MEKSINKVTMTTLQGFVGKGLSKEEKINRVLNAKQLEYHTMPEKLLDSTLTSEMNLMLRRKHMNCIDFGITCSIGDVLYIDFGTAYLNEAGYQHFGLVVNIKNGKPFVVPMTSNPITYAQAYDEKYNPSGKKHLMRIGLVNGLVRESVLFLNDAKFINSARIIDKKAYISPYSPLFRKIKNRLNDYLFYEKE